jgi:hypothetical protein
MIVYSHRGNNNGIMVENNPKLLPLDRWKCEVDLWKIKDNFFLGHDGPQYPITIEWLKYKNPDLLIHAKNAEALQFLMNFRYSLGFWHQTDDFALTIDPARVIIYPGKQLIPDAIIMKPELYDWNILIASNPYAICTDYPELYS